MQVQRSFKICRVDPANILMKPLERMAWIKVQVLLVNQWQCLDLVGWLLSFPTTNHSWETILMRLHSWCITFLMEDGRVFGQRER